MIQMRLSKSLVLIINEDQSLINDPNAIIEKLGIDFGDTRAVRTARTQISQIKAELLQEAS